MTRLALILLTCLPALVCAETPPIKPELHAWEEAGEYRTLPATLPTVEWLSRGTNLTDYIVEWVRYYGARVPLPPGRIKCERLVLKRIDGAVIQGNGTTIEFTGPKDRAAIRQTQCVGLKLEDLTLEFGGDLLWSMEHWHGHGTLRTTFNRVVFRQTGEKRTGRAMRFAREQREATCADVLFNNCFFRNYDSCLHVVGNQAVRILVTNITDVWHCNRVWQIDGGGHLQMDGKSSVIGAKEIARFGPKTRGSSLQPVLTLKDVYIDDAGPPARLVDMSQSEQYWQTLVIQDVKCNIRDGKGEGFDLIIGPHKSRFGKAKITVERLTKTGRANTVPVTPPKPVGGAD